MELKSVTVIIGPTMDIGNVYFKASVSATYTVEEGEDVPGVVKAALPALRKAYRRALLLEASEARALTKKNTAKALAEHLKGVKAHASVE